jgi:hypothetical protein
MLQTLPGRVRPVFTAQAQPLKQKRTELTLHSPPQYRTPQGSTKSLLTHILKQHLTEEGPGDAVAPEDARIFLATKSAAPSERSFSAAGNAQGPRQAAMSQETLQAIVTLRAWWKPGVLGFDSVLETFGCMEAAESLADDGG